LFALPISGDGPVSMCLRTQSPVFIKDVQSSTLKRKDLAKKYGIGQIAFVPFEGGVLEYGTSNGRATADWKELPECPTMPKTTMRKAFENLGASYCLFWERDGDEFVCIADFLTESRRKALAQVRGDGKSFASVSRGQRLNAKGDGPVALAARVGKEIVIDSKTMDGVMKRASLAREYGIKRLHFVPTNEGVFEYGTPNDAFLSGPLMEASLQMRCQTSGAGYAMYWKEVDEQLVIAGEYVTPERQETLKKLKKEISFAEASQQITLDAKADSPVAKVLQTRAPVFIQDVKTCTTMDRAGLAADYAIGSVCLVPVEGGVIEYGTSCSESTCTVDWESIEDAETAVMPRGEMKRAFENGATHVIFWRLVDGFYVCGADYVLPERLRALKGRGIDSSYTSESEAMRFPADGPGPVATAARSGAEIVIENPDMNPAFKRAALAKKYGVGNIHFVPCKDGVLEYGSAFTA